MRAAILAGCLCIALAACVGRAEAGSNAGSSAWLSSASDAAVAAQDDRITNFPILVNLSGVRDVTELAIHLKWSPYDPAGGCFQVVSAPRSATSGWSLQQPPGAAFNGDSTYTGTIQFPEGVTKNLVTFWISRGPCNGYTDGLKVVLAAVYVRDSKGSIDAVSAARDTLVLARSTADPALVPGPSVRPPEPKPTDRLELKVTPSPAQAVTRLSFSIPPMTPFGLAVFDVAGRLVRKIDAIPGDDGRGEGIWDLRDASGSRVPRGIYFARVTTLQGGVSRRIVVAH